MSRQQQALARSPITQVPPVRILRGWAVSGCEGNASLTLSDQSPLSKAHIRAPRRGLAAKALVVPFGRAELSDNGGLVIGSGPGEWLVVGGFGDVLVPRWESLLANAVGSGEPVTVLDLTHGRALVRLHGPESAHILAKVCALDFGDAMFPHGAAARSSVAKLATDIVRDDRDGERSYLLHCERSSGQYLFDSLLDAGTEFGLEVHGFGAG